MPVHYDSVFTPGARVADASSRPRPRNDRPGCIVLRVERYELKPVLDAQGRPMLAPQKDAEGRCVLAPDGQRLLVPQQEAVGVYGTASCSGEKIYMRLSTDEELKADGYAKGASANRHSINVIRLGAAEGIVRGRRGEMADPALLAPDQRPYWRCDKATFLRDARGEPLMTSDGYTQMRCSWISAYCNYRDKADRQVDMLSHISADKYATLTVSLRSDRGASPSAVNYYGLFADTLKDCAQRGVKRFSDACWEASHAIVKAWQRQAGKGQPEHFGRLAVTIWDPGFSLRFDLGSPQEKECAQRLAAWLANPKFENIWKTDSQGIERELPSFCQPELLVRLLNASGEVCGAARVRPWSFDVQQRCLAASGQTELAQQLATPEGKASWIIALGQQEKLGSGEEVRGLDVLCGESSRVSRVFENTSYFGSSSGPSLENAISQSRRMISLALCHTQNILPRRSRQHIGCSQCFISRTREGIVAGLFQTRDAVRNRNAVLLGPNGASLACSHRFASDLMAENHLREDLAYALSPAQAQAQNQAQVQGQAQALIQAQSQNQNQSQNQTAPQEGSRQQDPSQEAAKQQEVRHVKASQASAPAPEAYEDEGSRPRF